MDLPDLVDDVLLAQALNCKPETVHDRALAGDLPGVKLGRGWVFPREAVLEAINDLAREQAKARRAGKAPQPAAVAVPVLRKSKRPLPVLPEPR